MSSSSTPPVPAQGSNGSLHSSIAARESGCSCSPRRAGADTHPDWYHNLVANPDVTVEIGSDVRSGRAVEIVGGERDAIYARQGHDIAFFAEYQAGTDRTIPVIELILDRGPRTTDDG